METPYQEADSQDSDLVPDAVDDGDIHVGSNLEPNPHSLQCGGETSNDVRGSSQAYIRRG